MNKHASIICILASLALVALACNITGGTFTPLPPSSSGSSSPEAVSPEAVIPSVVSEATSTPGLSYISMPSDPATFVSGVKDEVFPSSYGDNFQSSLYERSFQLDNTYRPDADIMGASLSDNGDWYYFSTQIVDINPATKTHDSPYGIEIDVNRDGRGEFLLWATPPYSSTWTKNNVQLFKDANVDVGGPRPLLSDAPNFKGDGYETLLFDRGSGSDADAAWVRQSPTDPTTLQIAVKKTSIGHDSFLWGAWTDFGLASPAQFDYNDFFTAQQAGSPYASDPNYPLKALYGMDNTCRVAYGFTPTGQEPGICGAAQPTKAPTPKPTSKSTPKPTSKPTTQVSNTPVPPVIQPGSINGIVFFDNNANYVFDAGDEGKNTYELRLFQNGTCSGSAYLGALPASDGNYNLTNLPAGTWCLQLLYSGTPVHPGNPQVVIVPSGGATTVNFAIEGPG